MAILRSSYRYHSSPKILFLAAFLCLLAGIFTSFYLDNYPNNFLLRTVNQIATGVCFAFTLVALFFGIRIVRNPPHINLYDIGFTVPHRIWPGKYHAVRYSHILSVETRDIQEKTYLVVRHRGAKRPVVVSQELLGKIAFGELFTTLDFVAQNPENRPASNNTKQLRVLCEICRQAFSPKPDGKPKPKPKVPHQRNLDLCPICVKLTPAKIRRIGSTTMVNGCGLAILMGIIISVGLNYLPRALMVQPVTIFSYAAIGILVFGLIMAIHGAIVVMTCSLDHYPKSWLPRLTPSQANPQTASQYPRPQAPISNKPANKS